MVVAGADLSKQKMFKKLVIAGDDDPVKNTNFNRNLQPWEHANRRVGAPKVKWAKSAAEYFWNSIRHKLPENIRAQPLNLNDNRHTELIRLHANG